MKEAISVRKMTKRVRRSFLLRKFFHLEESVLLRNLVKLSVVWEKGNKMFVKKNKNSQTVIKKLEK